MAYTRKSLASVAATAVIGGALSVAGLVVASPASAVTSSSASHSVVTNIAPAHPNKLPPLCDETHCP
jgi:hypothetical protein